MKASIERTSRMQASNIRASGACILVVLALIALLDPAAAALTSSATTDPPAPPATARDVEQRITTSIKHAETYYWFGMAERGNMEAFDRGLHHLEQAERALNEAGEEQRRRDALAAQIAALRIDLEQQADIAHDTLHGVFPLVRLLRPSLLADALATGTFEMIDDPAVIAATGAASLLAERILMLWKARPQLNVMFTSTPADRALENEVLYVFNRNPRYFVHNRREVVSVLTGAGADVGTGAGGGSGGGEDTTAVTDTDSPLARLELGALEAADAKLLMAAFGVSDLLIVKVRQMDLIDEDYFYVLEGAIYHAAQDATASAPSHISQCMGFCRDRRSVYTSVIAANAILAALAVAAYLGLVMLLRRCRPRLLDVVPPLLGFALGRVAPWALMPLLGRVAPPAETLAVLSWWWPALAGAALLLVPLLLCRILLSRLNALSSALHLHGRVGPLITAVALGACAYLAGPYFLYLGVTAALSALLPTVIAAGALGMILGAATDRVDPAPVAVAALSVVVAPGLGLAVGHTAPLGLWLCAGISAGGVGWLIALRRTGDVRETTMPVQQRVAVSDDELAKLCQAPPYCTFDRFESAWEQTRRVLLGETVRLGFAGGHGVGKTALAGALIERLRGEPEPAGKSQPAVLSATCEPGMKMKDDGSIRGTAAPSPERAARGDSSTQSAPSQVPYGPFRDALADIFGVSLFASQQEQLGAIESALGDLIDSVVPFCGLLLPAAQDEGVRASSRAELHQSVWEAIQRLAQRHPITVLFIDDVQWLDEASRELLEFLLVRLQQEGDRLPVLVLLAGADAGLLEELLSPSAVTCLDPPDLEECEKILTSSLGLEPDSARQLTTHLGTDMRHHGALFCLFDLVSELARSGAFEQGERGFDLKDEYRREGALPMPVDLRAKLAAQLWRTSEHLLVLQCAACIGMEFSVTTLCSSLHMDRLRLIHILDAIERKRGILRDDKSQDDVFRFSSTFMLTVVRQELGVVTKGPLARDVPQVIREHHGRLGLALEETLEKRPGALYQTATHYFAAGYAKAQKALEYCLQASAAARRVYNHDQAHRYVEMAAESELVLGGRGNVTAQERLLVLCDESFTTGQGVQAAAQAALDYLESHPDAPGQVRAVAARACYDAGRAAGREGLPFLEHSRDLGLELVARGGSVIDQAEGHHFAGLGMLSLRDGDDWREEGFGHLRAALELLGDPLSRPPAVRALWARIANSLAGWMAQGDAADTREAAGLFELSLEIRKQPECLDLAGQARCLGGLGRLCYFGTPPDTARARGYFEADLELCLRLNDVSGEAQMHSLLGGCDKLDGNLAGALDHYRRSWDLSEGDGGFNAVFAGTGVLACGLALGKLDEAQAIGERLAAIATHTGLPEDCAKELIETFERHAPGRDEPWLQELRRLAAAVRD